MMRPNLGVVSLPLSWWVIIGLSAALALSGIAYKLKDAQYQSLKAEFSLFENRVRAEGEAAEKVARQKEKDYEKRIKTATGERDTALARLRNRPPSRKLSSGPEAPAGSETVCFPTATYNAALRRYRERLER